MATEALVDARHGFVFGEWRYPTGGVYGPLGGAYATLLMIHQGAARVHFDGKENSLVAGECAVIVSRRSLEIAYQKHISTHVSWCEARPVPPDPTAASWETSIASKLPISEQLLQLQRMGIALGLHSGGTRNEFRNALGSAVFGAYAFECKLNEDQQRIPVALRRVRRFIEEHFSEECSLTRLAEVAALTPTHLAAAFSRHLGSPPIRYLWAVRAEQARRLLLHTGLPNAEIAHRCGYKSPFHFSRHIKKVFGLSPTDLRLSKAYRAPSNELEPVSDVRY